MNPEEYKRRYHSDPEFRAREVARARDYRNRHLEKSRAQARERYHRMTDEQREARNARRRGVSTAKLTPEERRRIRIHNLLRAARPQKPPEPKRVPGDVRKAWKFGHENSAIRRKYPTTRDLARGAERGDFDHLEA